ncbi:MAG: single-stranded DNA-binding protein, partial [Chloroflexota bacterium]
DGQYVDEVDWYRVAAFGRQAEIADQYLAKGLKVLVDGQPQIRNFTDQNGVERTSVEIRADNFQMLNTREEADQIRASAGMSPSEPGGSGAYGGQRQQPQQQDSDNYDDFDDEDLDDVPF